MLAMKTALPAVVLAMLLAIPIVAVSQQAGQNPTSVSRQTDDLPRHRLESALRGVNRRRPGQIDLNGPIADAFSR